METQKLFFENIGSCSVVAMNGRLDANTGPDLTRTFNELLESGSQNLIFDMSGLEFLSSYGWWALIQVYRKMRETSGGELVLVIVPGSRFSETLETLKMNYRGPSLVSFPDLPEALAHFGCSPDSVAG